MTSRFKGTGVALATPMKPDHSIDYEGFGNLIDHVVNGGVDYVVLMGTTGESPTIRRDEKMALLDFLFERLAGSIPIVYGLGGNDTSLLIEEIKQLDRKPIDAILSASPFYNKPSQEGIFQHYTALASATEYPIIIYNVPHRTSSNISAETTLRLSEITNIIGTKEASGDLYQCGIIARDKPDDFLLLSGDDFLTLPILSIGGQGVISVIANAFPQAVVNLVKTALSGDLKTATRQHLAYLEMLHLSVSEGNPSSIKAALEGFHICPRHVRLPLIDASDELVDSFRKLRA